jgi:CheY-like chemotaxis protein
MARRFFDGKGIRGWDGDKGIGLVDEGGQVRASFYPIIQPSTNPFIHHRPRVGLLFALGNTEPGWGLMPSFWARGTQNCPTWEQRGSDMKAVTRRMKTPLRVLHLEDNSWDAELIRSELAKHEIRCSIHQLCTKKDFEAALQKGGVDIILSDSQLPGFDTLRALTRTREICPAVPFVFISGTTSPAFKANAFFRGAVDFIPKDQLSRLRSVFNRLFSADNSKHEISPLPEIGIPVMVYCREFRCLGYLDRKGKWRDFTSSVELANVIDWSDL